MPAQNGPDPVGTGQFHPQGLGFGNGTAVGITVAPDGDIFRALAAAQLGKDLLGLAVGGIVVDDGLGRDLRKSAVCLHGAQSQQREHRQTQNGEHHDQRGAADDGRELVFLLSHITAPPAS